MKKLNTNWDKLRIFHQIAKVGSFNAAADLLNISQPALSRTISLLEDHLSTRLFERLPRGLILTRQGEILFDTIQQVWASFEKAQILLEEEENDPIGSLKVVATTGFASLHLSTLLPDFLRSYPRIQISIDGNDSLPNLHSDEADALIAPFIEEDDSLIQTYLTTYHLKLYASQEYLENFGRPKKPSDLSSHRLLAFGDKDTLHPFSQANWHLTLGSKKGQSHLPYITMNSAIGLFNLATAGMGIASISAEHPPLKDSSLVEVLPEVSGPTIDAYFIYSSRLRKVKRIQLLKDFLVKTFETTALKEEKNRNIPATLTDERTHTTLLI